MMNGQSCITVSAKEPPPHRLALRYDADLNRLGAQREKLQRLRAEVRALLSG